MNTLHENEQRRYADVLAAMVHELHDGHRLLLDSVVEAEQVLLADLEPHQKQTFMRYKEVLDELQALYQLAAYEAGQGAAADIPTGTVEQAAPVLSSFVSDQTRQAESRSHVTR